MEDYNDDISPLQMFDKNRPPGPPDSSWEARPGAADDSQQGCHSTVLDVAAMKQLYEDRLQGNKFGRDNRISKPVATSADKEAAFRVFNQLPGARKKLLKGMSDAKEAKGSQGTVVKEVVIPDAGLSVRELSSRLSMKVPFRVLILPRYVMLFFFRLKLLGKSL